MKNCKKNMNWKLKSVMELCRVEHIVGVKKLFNEHGEKGTKMKMMKERLDLGAREKRQAKTTFVLEGESSSE